MVFFRKNLTMDSPSEADIAFYEEGSAAVSDQIIDSDEDA
jgi:hypothetical protein